MVAPAWQRRISPSALPKLAGAVTQMSESAQMLPIPLTQALFNDGVELPPGKLVFRVQPVRPPSWLR
jgi:hypothetical protein